MGEFGGNRSHQEILKAGESHPGSEFVDRSFIAMLSRTKNGFLWGTIQKCLFREAGVVIMKLNLRYDLLGRKKLFSLSLSLSNKTAI